MKKIVKTSLADQISDYIRDEILSGTWKPGEKLPSENELAKELGVSRMSLRSGIQKCNAVGLTETRVGEGTFVCQFSLRTYFDQLYSGGVLENRRSEVNDLRFVLQVGSVRLAMADGISSDALETLDNCCKRMEHAASLNDMDLFHQEDCQFHRTICRMCKNNLIYMLYDAMEFLMDDMLRDNVMRSVRYANGFDNVLLHHRLIVDALKEGSIDQFIRILENADERSEKEYVR